MYIMASQITGKSNFCSNVCSGVHQRKSKLRVTDPLWGNYQWPVVSLHKGTVIWKMSLCHDVIPGTSSCFLTFIFQARQQASVDCWFSYHIHLVYQWGQSPAHPWSTRGSYWAHPLCRQRPLSHHVCPRPENHLMGLQRAEVPSRLPSPLPCWGHSSARGPQ